jgi:hypothetical protein
VPSTHTQRPRDRLRPRLHPHRGAPNESAVALQGDHQSPTPRDNRREYHGAGSPHNLRTCWRRGWDSNPRKTFILAGFRPPASKITQSRSVISPPKRGLLDNYYAVVRKGLTMFRGGEVNTAGDGLLATFDGPARAIRCACSVRERVHPLGLQVRTGLHTGECELMGDDVGGITVHIGPRVAATAAPDEVVVSSASKTWSPAPNCSSSIAARTSLKGVPGRMAPVRCPVEGGCFARTVAMV